MRVNEKLKLVFKFLLVETAILCLIGVVFYFQFDSAKTEFVNKTRLIAETIGDQAGTFFEDFGKEPTSDEFYLFLSQKSGIKRLFNTFEISPFYSVIFKKDVEQGAVSGYFMKDFYPQEGYSVQKGGGRISVSVPFVTPEKEEPFGIVKINSDTKTLIKKVFSDNFLLYAAMLVVLNNQAFILYLFSRRKKEEIIDKGYLKEHSIGALKVMHKVLGDIVEDHVSPGDDKNIRKESEKKVNQELTKNVISISNLASKRKE
ncbi:MAG: hypothetical protein ACRENO_02025 [Thermodesulfobacteriota bacterium]